LVAVPEAPWPGAGIGLLTCGTAGTRHPAPCASHPRGPLQGPAGAARGPPRRSAIGNRLVLVEGFQKSHFDRTLLPSLLPPSPLPPSPVYATPGQLPALLPTARTPKASPPEAPSLKRSQRQAPIAFPQSVPYGGMGRGSDLVRGGRWRSGQSRLPTRKLRKVLPLLRLSSAGTSDSP
jgi:hypothetical protein